MNLDGLTENLGSLSREDFNLRVVLGMGYLLTDLLESTTFRTKLQYGNFADCLIVV